jgi:hypothetical protein
MKLERSTNITGPFVENKRISKNCVIFENQKAQLMWDKNSRWTNLLESCIVHFRGGMKPSHSSVPIGRFYWKNAA